MTVLENKAKIHIPLAVLALDSGGSKCEALLVAADGTVLRFARVSEPGQSGRSPATVERATCSVLKDIIVDNLIKPMDIDPENTGPLALAGETYGIVVTTGTGARVTGTTRDGRRLVLDGFGPVLGDEGSGYQIGLAAMRAAARAERHPRHATTLQSRILEICCDSSTNKKDDPIKKVQELVGFSLKVHDRSVIAGMARIVDEEARRGDVIALEILKNSAQNLSETVRDLSDRLAIASDDYPLLAIGSVAVKSDIYWDEFSRRVLSFAPRFRMIRLKYPPAAGVALVALSRMDGVDIQAVRQRLFSSIEEVMKK